MTSPRRLIATPLLAALWAGGALAQPAPSPSGPRPPAPIAIQTVKPGLYLITGKGANSTLRVTPDGAFLVDSKNVGADALAELQAAIRSVSPQPVKVVFITNHHGDHSGNTGAFVEAGARVVATQAENDAIARYKPANGSAPPAPPNQPFEGASHVERLGGLEARALKLGSATTGDDLMVYFPDLKVVATGDAVLAAGTPNADFPYGGSVLGWQKTLKALLALDFDTVIPGQGPPMTRDQVVAYAHKWDLLIDRARALVKAGVPKEQLIAQIKTDDLGWNINFPFWTQPVRLDPFYAEMAQ